MRLEVRRDALGQITLINRVKTFRELRKSILGSVLFAGIGYYMLLPLESDGFPRSPIWGAVALGGGLLNLALTVFVALRHSALFGLVADQRGISLRRFYRELGVVPWSAVDRLVIEATELAERGNSYLVAHLHDEETYKRKLGNRPDGRMLRLALGVRLPAPPTSEPPFAAIESERSIDLQKLKAVLEELWHQGSLDGNTRILTKAAEVH
jgi:hypothetical protein